MLRRGKETDARRRTLETQREALIAERGTLTQKNQLRQRIATFADKVASTIDKLNFEQRQNLLRLLVEDVRVKGWQVEIKLRIPLDDPPSGASGNRVSSKDRLRSLHDNQGTFVPAAGTQIGARRRQLTTTKGRLHQQWRKMPV